MFAACLGGRGGVMPSTEEAQEPLKKMVEGLRVRDESGAFRVVYTARLAAAVYVLHAFQKKTQATSKHDIEVAEARYSELMKVRK